MSTDTVPERYARQNNLAPHDRLAAARAVVVGCGAVGRQVAVMLASMGVGRLALWDPDTVDEVNLGPQGWRPEQLGFLKANAIGTDLWFTMPRDRIEINNSRFARSDWRDLTDSAVFCCVDSMEGRRLVWDAAVRAAARWFGDCRVAGETIRVLAESAPAEGRPYPGTLVRDDQAFQGSCSGARMAIYGATCAATLVVARFAQWLRGAETAPSLDLMLNLLALEIAVTEGR